MKKLKLEELEVESYETGEEAGTRGTVHAHGEPYTQQGSCSCPHVCTRLETCPYSCYIIETCEPGICY